MATKKKAEQPEATEAVAADDQLQGLEELREPEAETSDYDPAADDAANEKAKADKEKAIKAAQSSALVTVQVLEAGLGMVFPGVSVAAEQKMAVAQKLAPVLAKYNAGGMPPWLAAYREELDLLTVLGVVGLSVYGQVKAANAKDVTPGGGDGSQSESEAA